MRKILSFFAFVAIVLTFAACNGNEPEVKGFTLKVETLSNKVHFVVTSSNPNMYFIFDYVVVKGYYDDFNNPRELAEYYLEHESYYVQKAKYEDTHDVLPNTQYIAFAFYIDANLNIVGEVYSEIFTTMPEYTLNGEFTVDENGKKVRFMQANMQQASSFSGLSLMENQLDYKGTNTGYPRDLFTWDKAMNALPNTAPYRMLSVNEWYYVFKARPNAEKLFAHACINGTNGVLLLPDNWQTPDGINLTPSVQMGMEWKDGGYINLNFNFNGYEKNKYNTAQWETLEFAGAVFLPAAGGAEGQVDGVNEYGLYWSSTGAGGDASYLLLRPNALYPTSLYSAVIYNSIRPVREIK